MKPAYSDRFVTLYIADAIEALRELPEQSVHACVCSPPYFGLRAYLDSEHEHKSRELGSEKSPREYVENLCGVFDEVWRVLRNDGTVWLNLGDAYNNFRSTAYVPQSVHNGRLNGKRNSGARGSTGFKEKDLMGIPWRVAFALQDAGWYLRSAICWTKPNPMPESVTDRPTSAYEMVFMLAKQARYFYDQEAVRENFADERMGNPGAYKRTTSQAKGANRERQDLGFLNNGNGWNADGAKTGRNMRNVWNLPTRPFKGSHFATFPIELPIRCIKAATSEYGVCGAKMKKLRLRPDLSADERAEAEAFLRRKRLV